MNTTYFTVYDLTPQTEKSDEHSTVFRSYHLNSEGIRHTVTKEQYIFNFGLVFPTENAAINIISYIYHFLKTTNMECVLLISPGRMVIATFTELEKITDKVGLFQLCKLTYTSSIDWTSALSTCKTVHVLNTAHSLSKQYKFPSWCIF